MVHSRMRCVLHLSLSSIAHFGVNPCTLVAKAVLAS